MIKKIKQEIKDFFGITGGEYIQIIGQINKLESQNKDEKYLKAELDYYKLNNDIAWSPNAPLQREIDIQQLNKLKAIVQEGDKIEQEKKLKLEALERRKIEIENHIIKLKHNKEKLESRTSKPYEEEIGILKNRIKTRKYEVDRDKKFILNKIHELDNQIDELKHKKDLCDKNDPIKIELDIEIHGLKIQKDSIILYEWRQMQNQREEASKYMAELERQIKALEADNGDQELTSIKDKLKQLVGGGK